MGQKKRLWKLTGYIFLALIVCTGLARQFQRMLLPQVTVAPLGAGTLTHQDVYTAILGEAGDGIVSWQVDERGYRYYGENQKANLVWTDNDGNERTEALKIAKKTRSKDGEWEFTMDAARLSENLPADTTISVWMESKIAYGHTLPLAALSMDADGYVIYTVETHQGVFSDVQTVHHWPVDVIDQDNVMAAVSSGQTDQVVTYTSKPLWDNMQVVIAE